ncbi:TonB-dependent receptor [Sphingobacterium sp. JB170]|uniref:SusC/RagA family TonB-linked outer membrane protein n=1 Tax=Sphingobacterium sp. JB170 TaxID=1434842 RepID=UPI00097F59A3|nr:TonB-dependent receptor [Sphingobacterium sp. JB170]SJN48924.1 TonB family protein / TonB-dependent receptor [Sphingobacterium sp. JB170]
MKNLLLMFVLLIFGGYVSAQSTEFSGLVTDPKGTALAGVSVRVTDTNSGTSTLDNGTFNFTAQNLQPVTLQFTLIGYNTLELQATPGKPLKVTLVQSDEVALEEAVAVGYGTVRKSDLTGAVGTVQGKDLQARGTTSAMAALQGTVPGVDISSNSTRPGASFSIQVRGQNSLQAGSPLYIVDGIATSNIDFLNPADISQIDILKDASSTAIYGSRGSNGVVIVKTKNANRPGDTRSTITYDGYYGIRKLARIPDFMDGREWVDFRTSAFYTYADGSYGLPTPETVLQNSPILENRLYNEDYEDWLGLGTQSGQQQNHYIGISGASDKLDYNLGVGYQQEEGNFIKEQLDRYTLKLSVQHRFSDVFTSGASINFVHSINNFGSQYGYRDILRMPNILSAYDENGELIAQPGIASAIDGLGNFTSSPNPLNEINSGTEEIRQYDVLSSIFAEFRPIEDLSIRSTFLPRFNRTRTGQYFGVVPGTRNQDQAFQNNEEFLEWTWDNVINYKKQFHEDHKLDVSLIQSAYKTRYENLSAASMDLPYPSWWYNLYSGKFVSDGSNSSYNETSLLSFAARANYDYKGRYLLTGTIRYDGSSKLKDKWAAFPSAAFAWRISEEPFMQVDAINDLKARVSWGYSGNNNGINPFGTQQGPQTGSLVWYDYDGRVLSGFAPGRPVNQSLTWEKTREVNVGLDFSLFNSRVQGTLDIYDKLSDGLLMQRTLTVESGVDYMIDNIGSVNNRGIEIGLTTTNIRKNDFRWSTSFMFSHNKNAIRSLYGKKEDVIGQQRFIGEPINVIYDYRITGLWRIDQIEEAVALGQQPGQAIAQDVNGDDNITPDDRTILGNQDPSWIGSFTNNIQYKNFDFSFNLYARQGMFISSAFLDEFGPNNTQRGRPKIKYDYYVPPGVQRYDWTNWDTNSDGTPEAVWGTSGQGNENAKYPHPQNKGPFYGNNGRYTSASFVKLRNIVLGYSLPERVISKWKMSQFRIYANVLNPFVFTSYEGWDPEYATTSLQDGNGPSSITYQLGVNVRF